MKIKILKASKTHLLHAIKSTSHSELMRFSTKHNVEFNTITYVFQQQQIIGNDRKDYWQFVISSVIKLYSLRSLLSYGVPTHKFKQIPPCEHFISFGMCSFAFTTGFGFNQEHKEDQTNI